MKRQNKKLMNEKGMVAYFTLGMLVVLEVAGLAMLTNQNASLNDTHGALARGQAKFMAQSALQEAKYYIKNVSAGWTGTRPEQVVTVNDRDVGSYEYIVTSNENTYTVVATGYYPNKASRIGISQTLTTSFTYPFALNPGIIVLDGAAAKALKNSGTPNVRVYGGQIYVNSSAANAMYLNGNATVNAPKMNIVGALDTVGGPTVTGTVIQGATAVPDPLAHLAEPTSAGLTSFAAQNLGNNSNVTLSPGLYPGITIGAGATVTMNPGLYYINGGGFSVSGNSVLTANGVTIFNNPLDGNDNISIGGTGNVTLTPMSTGTYDGIAIWQKRTSALGMSIGGNGSLNVSGIIYAKGAELALTGGGTLNNLGTLDICNTLLLGGNGALTINDY